MHMIWWHSADRDVLPGRFQPCICPCNNSFYLIWVLILPEHENVLNINCLWLKMYLELCFFTNNFFWSLMVFTLKFVGLKFFGPNNLFNPTYLWTPIFFFNSFFWQRKFAWTRKNFWDKFFCKRVNWFYPNAT